MTCAVFIALISYEDKFRYLVQYKFNETWVVIKKDCPWYFQLYYLSTSDYLSIAIRKKGLIFKTTPKKFNTVRNLITFTIVFTNKNGMDRFNPPIKKAQSQSPIKTKVKENVAHC